MNILDKIQKLRDWFSGNKADNQDLTTIDNWLAKAKRLILLDGLAQHDGMKYVTEIFQSEVSKINEALSKSYSKDLPDLERDRLLDRRDLAQKYLSLFESIPEQLENLENSVDYEMSKQ